MAGKKRDIKDWAISQQIHWVNDKWTVLIKPALLGEKKFSWIKNSYHIITQV